MTAELLRVDTHCRKCGKGLTLEEMHYYAEADGSATCEDCEVEWLRQVEAWKRGDRDDFPSR